MYTVKPTTKLQKDLKREEKRGYDISLLTEVLVILASGVPLPKKYKDHPLKGDPREAKNKQFLTI